MHQRMSGELWSVHWLCRNGVSLLDGFLWDRAQSLVQPLPLLTESFWVSLSLQDSDGDKSDYNLVVDEVSPHA